MSWSLVPSSLPSNLNYISVVSNSSGNYLLANVKSNDSYGVYMSSSYGISWSPTSAPVNKPYAALAINSTGQYAIVAANGEYIYLSSSYGVNWSQTTATLAPWYSLSVNSSGQYMIGAATGVGTYVSSNYGISWQIPVTFSNSLDINTFLNQSWTRSSPSNVGSANWAGHSCSISTTGNAIFAVSVNATTIAGMYYSTNYGQYWIQSNITTAGWNSAASTDCKYAVTSQWYGGLIYYSSNYGKTWIASVNGSVTSGYGHGMSGNGEYAIAGSVSYSNNYGVNWYSATGGNSNPAPCAMSYTGQYALSATSQNGSGTLLFSSTYGKTWTSTVLTTGGTITMNNWGQPAFARGPNSPYAISSSSNYGVCYSTNYGYSWTQSNLTTFSAGSVTMSATGQYALIGKNQASDVYITTNYGIFWQITSDKQVAFYNNALAVSSDFKYLISAGISGIFYQTLPGIDGECAISSSGQYAITTAPNTVYVSSNYGNSWPTSSITGSKILGATVNSTGDYMAVSVVGIGIYISSNYGNSWIKSNADNGSWRMIKMSSSGNIVYGLKNDGTNNYYIQSSSSYGMNWTATTSPFLKWYSITMDDAATRIFAVSVLNGVYLLGQLFVSIITPAASQNIQLSIVTNSATVTATSTSPGALSYYLSTSFGTTTANASINASTGTVSINGPGTINVYVTQSAYGTSYAAITTPTLAGTISVLAIPTIRPAATQTVTFS